jgi:hypothetical protein
VVDVQRYSRAELAKKLYFTCKSKYSFLKNAMKQLYNLHYELLKKDDLKITFSKAVEIPIDDHFEIAISLVFELNNSKQQIN